MAHDLKAILTALPLFAKLDSDEINQLTRKMTVEEYASDAPLLVEGLPSDRLMVVLDGTVSVVKGSGESAHHICDLDAGECVGEIGVLDNSPCSANVVAKTDVEAAWISSEDLDSFFGSNRIAAIKILREMVLILAGRLRQTNVSYSSLKSIVDEMD